MSRPSREAHRVRPTALQRATPRTVSLGERLGQLSPEKRALLERQLLARRAGPGPRPK